MVESIRINSTSKRSSRTVYHQKQVRHGSTGQRGLTLRKQRAEHPTREQVSTISKDFTDSIYYAERIQNALRKNPVQLDNYFAESFVLYQPKDIVSGDFYWFHRKEYRVFIAVVDCTGHGVPGALMSVIGNNLFRETIVNRNMDDPGEILFRIDTLLSELFNHDTITTADGMDVALAVFDFEKNEVAFSGAFRPLVHLRKNTITEIKGSRYPIGLFNVSHKKFSTQQLDFQTGDQFYLFSDGYNDQFGGPNDKKFTRRRLYQLLLDGNHSTLTNQKKHLEASHQKWRGKNPQTDDILMIGLKIG